ncbi:MAG: hypothetical protein ACUZ8E_17325 [Candidatus Anammoxibacter sp.]
MSKVEFKYDLGIRVRDRVTGTEGIIDMRTEYLNGCIRYSVQPKAKTPNPEKMPESYWFDENQIEFVDNGLNDNPVRKRLTGGPVESSSSAKF